MSEKEIIIGDEDNSSNQPQETKPKAAKRKSRASWKPANLIEIPDKYKDPNYDYRCVDWHRAGRVLQKQNEHWEVDKKIAKQMTDDGLVVHTSLDDGAPQDGTLRFRELVVMRIRKEYSEARERYFQESNPLQNKLQEENDDLATKTGGRSYGNISLKKGG